MDPLEAIRFKNKNYRLVQLLTRETHFSQEEVEALLVIHCLLTKGAGDMKRKRFQEILHSAFDMTDDMILDRVFAVWDEDGDGIISMKEWAKGLSVSLRGTYREKVDFCFKVYDMMGDGNLTKEVMTYLLRNSLVKQSGDDESDEGVKDLVDLVLKKMDQDRDGIVSREDYVATVDKDNLMMESLGSCLPSRKATHCFLTSFTTKTGKM